MKIQTIHIVGFRNFKDCKINFADRTLLIGANDVGKSNLLYGMRLLLDKNLSESEITPTEKDFYAFEATKDFSITIHFTGIKAPADECVISCFKGDIKGDELFLQYKATRTNSGAIEYDIYSGHDLANLQKRETRFYLRNLNMEYISSYRDLKKYIKREQKYILEEVKSNRSAKEEADDLINKQRLERSLSIITKRVSNFSFIKSATNKFNTELKKLSAENQNREVMFDAGTADADEFINDLELVSKKNDKNLALGGDGRNNQVFISMWAGRRIASDTCVTFYAIEEPEAHLHPHQQRRLAHYLATSEGGQIFLTTHSPQIVSEFDPASIVRLFSRQLQTIAARDGVSPSVGTPIVQFAHRMNIISAEAFFSDAVILVEGVSEVIFYKAFAKDLGLDLDFYNVSVLSVEGVGYQVYIDLLSALEIPYCFRTDNDCSKVPRKDYYRNAGLNRIVDIFVAKKILTGQALIDFQKEFDGVYNQKEETQNKAAKDFIVKCTPQFKDQGLFLADTDLETDLAQSPLSAEILAHTGETDIASAIKVMKESKGKWMFGFAGAKSSVFKKLAGTSLEWPITFCLKQITQ